MPKPHLPLQGGPRPADWVPPVLAKNKSDSPAAPNPRQQELEAEVQRLRSELAHQTKTHGGQKVPDARQMIWFAVILCGGCLIFTIIALLRHG